MKTPTLTISIAVHNLWEMTQKCVESVLRYTPEIYTIFIIDNASGDETRLYLAGLARKHPNVKIIRNEKNRGFSEPHNEVFAASTSEYFLVLNNDVTLCPGWFERMLREFEEDPKLAACGIRNACIVLDDKGHGFPAEEDKKPEYVEGSCMMIRSAIVRDLPGGLFDPIYKFAYYEDSDLGLRIRSAGYNIAVVDIQAIHLGAQTSKTVKDVDLDGFRLRNQHVFLARWSGYLKSRKQKSVSKNRIVVRRAGAQGDVLLATPILRAIRRNNPKAVIVVETVCRDVLAGNPDVNEVVTQIRPLETDYVIDLNMAYENNPMVHVLDAYAKVANVELPDIASRTPSVYTNDTSRIVAAQRMPSGEKYAIIHPGAIDGWVGRQWPAKRWPDVISHLHRRGYKTVLVGNEATPQVGTQLDFRNVHFMHFAALMERAHLFVGLDSMPFHVAQSFLVPSVVIFGSVDPTLRIVPECEVVPAVASKIGCLGCHNWLPAPRTVTNNCLRGKELCMDGIEPGTIIAAIEEIERRTGESKQS